jgi:hypothetical protein
MHYHTLVDMSSSMKIGRLIKELIAIVWGYVGIDLSVLIQRHQAWTKDAAAFDFSEINWQKLAEDCAAFYPPGCEWLYILNLPGIQWTRVMYHSIRSGNLSFISKDKIAAVQKKLTDIVVFRNAHEYESFAPPLLFERDELFLIATVDSGSLEVFEWVKSIIPAHRSMVFSYVLAHAEGRGYLLNEIRNFYDYARIEAHEAIGYRLSVAWMIGNIEVVKKLLMLDDKDTYELFRRFAWAWEAGYAAFNPRITTLIYDCLKHDNSIARIIMCMMGDGEPHYWKEFAIFIIRKEGAGIISAFRTYLSPRNFAELTRWASSVITNDDTFWSEIGL